VVILINFSLPHSLDSGSVIPGEFAPAWKDPVRWLKKEAWADEVDPVEADNTIDHWQPPSLEQVEQIKKQCDQQYAGESHGH